MESDRDLPHPPEALHPAFAEAVADAGPHDLGVSSGAPVPEIEPSVAAADAFVVEGVDASASAAVDPFVQAAVEEPVLAGVEKPVLAAVARPASWMGHAAGIAVAAVGGAAIVLTTLVPKGSITSASVPARPEPARAIALAPAGSAATAVPMSGPPGPTPRWHPSSEWTGGRKKSVAYELTANGPVRVWMHQVTPLLVVRCLAGTLDAFVVTGSASAIETGRLDHTVRLGFDDAPEATEHWSDSADHDGLFAPEGKALVSRLSSSRTLRFTFTPHNAPPAEAVFTVRGADGLSPTLVKHCR